MLQRCFFVTGTDTGVGKTTVTCALAAATTARGCRVGVLKPIETGCRPDARGVLVPEDAETPEVLRLRRPSPSTQFVRIASPTPWRPVSQRVAMGTKSTSPAWCARFASSARLHDLTLIEGAGGLLVPIWGDTTFADLATQAEIPLLIVVGNRLGAINHAQLTAGWARAIGLETAGYIINTLSPDEDLAARTNVDVLADLLGPPLGIFPWLGEIACTDSDRRRLAEAAFSSIAISALIG